MMKKILCLCLVFTCVSCKDRKNLLNLLFPSTIAIDYVDDMYYIGLQIDNMNSIAKTELETSNSDTKLLVATSKASTIEEAILKIEENERSVINLSHVKAVILRPNTLNQEILHDICTYFSHNQELRMDSEVYFTQDNFTDLFSTSFQLSRSQLYTLINSDEFQRVAMAIDTINMMELTKAFNEPDITIHIPVLKVSDQKDTYITQNGIEKQKVYEINELLYLSKNTHHTIPLKDLAGIQWSKTNNSQIEINTTDYSAYSTRVFAFIYYNPFDRKYHLKGQANIVVNKDNKQRSLSELEIIVKQKVHDQIMHTYKIALENNIDVYNITYLSNIFSCHTEPTIDNFEDELKVKLHLKGSYIGSY